MIVHWKEPFIKGPQSPLQITEIETQGGHNQREAMLLDLENLKTISKTMAYVPEKNQLLSRENLIKAGRTYAEGLKVGSFVKVDSPWCPMHSVMKTASSWPARDALFPRGARL